MSARHACRLIEIARSTKRYRGCGKEREAGLRLPSIERPLADAMLPPLANPFSVVDPSYAIAAVSVERVAIGKSGDGRPDKNSAGAAVSRWGMVRRIRVLSEALNRDMGMRDRRADRFDKQTRQRCRYRNDHGRPAGGSSQ